MSLPTKIGRLDSLAFRLTLLYTSLSMVSLLAVLGISYVILQRQLETELERDLVAEVVEYEALLKSRGVGVLQELLDHEAESEGHERAYHRLYRTDATEVFRTDMSRWGEIPVDPESFLGAASDRQELIEIPANQSPFPARILYSPLGEDYIIELGRLADEEGAVLQNFRRMAVILSLMFAGISFVLGSVMANRALRGVRRVTETARRIAGGSWGLRVPVGDRRDEVADLADAFNEMIQRIQKLVAELRDVTDDIAHDLRTPIARMRAAAESCLDGGSASEEANELAGSVLEECDRLLQLINLMLEISHMEAGARQFEREPLDLAELSEDVFDLFRPAAEDKGITMRSDEHDPVMIQGDRQRLMRAVAHIVDNAVKYTEPGGAISLSCSRRNGSAVVTVRDTGIGIGEGDLTRIFDRFYRADASRAGSGHGLGLSASRAICMAHGGSISVSSRRGEGSTFEISVPVD